MRGRAGSPSPLFRLALGSALVAAVLAVLAATGLLSRSDSPEAAGDGAPPLSPADASIETPNLTPFPVGIRAGNVAPDFEFSDFEGRRLRLSDFRGRPVIVNFWASWCGPCRAEMADLEEAERQYRARSLTVIAVNNGESYKTGKRFIDEVGVRLSAFAFDPSSAVARRYAVEGMPTSYFIDSDGVITRVITGAVNERLLPPAVDEAIIGWGRVQLKGGRGLLLARLSQ